jgi:hypothetical protein
MRTRDLIAAAVGAVAATALAGGIAWAAIPGSDGVINGCYTRLTGSLRVIDADAGGRCVLGERSLQWNQRGPEGPAGPDGPAGPTGPSGPAGTTSVIVGRVPPQMPIIDDTTETLQALQLPAGAGTYVIEATVRGRTQEVMGRAYLFCELWAGDQQLDWYVFNFGEADDYDWESAQLTGWLDASGFEVVTVRCRADYDTTDGAYSNVGIDDHGAVVATRVDSLTEAF